MMVTPKYAARGDQAAGSLMLETAEGYLTLSPVSGAQLRRSLEAAGIGEAFSAVMEADRSKTMQVYHESIRPALLQRSALEWEEIFEEADVPAAAIRTFSEHLQDPQTIHNGTYRPVHDPTLDADWLMVRYPAWFDGAPPETAELPPPGLPSTD